MAPADVALNITGFVLGVGAAFAALLWLWLRSCERYSERGFGADA